MVNNQYNKQLQSVQDLIIKVEYRHAVYTTNLYNIDLTESIMASHASVVFKALSDHYIAEEDITEYLTKSGLIKPQYGLTIY